MGRMRMMMRDKIEEVVTAWERRSKASMHLDALLHKKIKADLIESLVAAIEAPKADKAKKGKPA